MLIDLSCPIENRGAIVKTNSETNEPYVLLKLLNISEKTITSISFDLLAYNSNGTLLATIPVELNELSALPKKYFAENKAISCEDINDAKNFVVSVKSATFEDESIYEPSDENTVDADDKEASVDDVLALRYFVPEAICFAKEHEDYYRCVCGRPNFLDSENCVRCGRAKDDLLKNFVSIESVNALLEEEKLAEEQKIAEENERLLAEKELKKKKTKKALLISAISLVVAAVLAVAGYFAYIAYLNISADKAVENGDYVKAFENYQKTGSDKIGSVVKYVQGNTPENLLYQGGLIAGDSENLYYLALDNATYKFNLIKENKKTKEKLTLTDSAGGSLNVTKDWIYFVDTESGYVNRISKDGQTIDSVLQTPVSYLSVIGNTMYFIKTDYDNPNNLSKEQCEVLASQGQMKSFLHLYKMNIDKKEPSLVIDESMSSCAIYGNRIYYLTQNEDKWLNYNLCSTNLNGEDKKVIVDTPVSTFLVLEDKLYFVPMYNGELKGQEITDVSQLDYSLYCMDLSENSVAMINSEYLFTYITTNGEKMFFTAYNREEYMNSQNGESQIPPTASFSSFDFKTEEISKIILADMQTLNIYEDDVIAYITYQGMCRFKTDGSEFEEISINSAEQTEEASEEQTEDTSEVSDSEQ